MRISDWSSDVCSSDLTALAFERREHLIIGLAPEGTRSRVTAWKRGFYHLASTANVPVLAAWIDYRSKTVGAGPVFRPSGDWSADLEPISAQIGRASCRERGCK